MFYKFGYFLFLFAKITPNILNYVIFLVAQQTYKGCHDCSVYKIARKYGMSAGYSQLVTGESGKSGTDIG